MAVMPEIKTMKIKAIDTGDREVGLNGTEWTLTIPDEDYVLLNEEGLAEEFEDAFRKFFESYAMVNGRVKIELEATL